ncbi:MAG: iron ABC transporter permease [Nitrospirota bacterium]
MFQIKILFLIFFSIAAFLCALFFGPKIILPWTLGDIEKEILLSIRLPRVIVAFLMGTALGVSGAVLQGILRNPLADPYVLGISSGASLVAALGILGGVTFLGNSTIPVLAFLGAMMSGGLVGMMGMRKGGLWPERLLLAGVGLSFLFSALLMLLLSISNDEGLRRALLWIFGDLSMSDWDRIPYGLIFILSGLALAMSRAKALNVLILGDELAHSLGFSPKRERLLLFISVGLMTAAAVSLGGMIGFIGLLMPHIMRFFFGADSRLLIPASALGGGSLLCIADLLSRSVLLPQEIPAGVVTAIIGAPYFLYVLRRKDVLSM